MTTQIFTIGHSSHTWESFSPLLLANDIELLVDVRSNPVSRFAPFANHRTLPELLESADMDKIYTIGFTGKSAREFFDLLNSTDAKYLADTRLNKNSQLAGFTKKGNIEYFVEKLTCLEYLELPSLAPEKEMFQQYRRDGDWDLYESRYIELLARRSVFQSIKPSLLDDGIILLCSERTPEKCHRRLAAEYLKANRFPEAKILHL